MGSAIYSQNGGLAAYRPLFSWLAVQSVGNILAGGNGGVAINCICIQLGMAGMAFVGLACCRLATYRPVCSWLAVGYVGNILAGGNRGVEIASGYSWAWLSWLRWFGVL